MEHVAVAARTAQRIGVAAGVDEEDLVARATCAIVRHEAEEISPMMQATLSRSIMRSALVEAVCGLTDPPSALDLAAHHAAGSVDLLDREVDGHDAIFAERTEKAGARRQVAEPDGIGVWRQNRGRGNSRHQLDAAGGPDSRDARIDRCWSLAFTPRTAAWAGDCRPAVCSAGGALIPLVVICDHS